MKKKEKKINLQKIKGTNIINVVDSPGTVIRKDTLIEELVMAMNGAPVKTIEPLSIIKSVLDGCHPFYRVVPDFSRTDGTSISLVAKTPDAHERCPIKGNMTVKIPDKYKNFNTLNELLLYSYHNQETIIFDENEITSFQIFLGNQLLQDFSNNGESLSCLTLVPEPFPEPRPMKIFIPNTAQSYDYIELGLFKIEGNVVYFSNIKQKDAPIRFYITLDIENKHSNYTIKFDEDIHVTARKILKLLEFLFALSNNNCITIIDLKTDKPLIEASSNKVSIDSNVEKEILFYKKIVDIENAFDIEFKLPEKMERDDWETIEYIHEVIKTGSYISTSDHYTITISGKEGLQQILDLVEKNPDQSCSLMMTEKECVAELFGEKLFFGDSKFYPPKLKLESMDELKAQIQFYREGTSIEVHLIPVEDNNYKRIFDNYIKVDEG